MKRRLVRRLSILAGGVAVFVAGLWVEHDHLVLTKLATLGGGARTQVDDNSGVVDHPNSSLQNQISSSVESQVGRQPVAQKFGKSGASNAKRGASGPLDLRQRLIDIDQQIQSVQNSLQNAQGDPGSSGFDERIRAAQQRVAELEAQTQTSPERSKQQIQNESLLASQDTTVAQQALGGLQQQMQAQAGVVGELNRQLQNTIAPDDSDIVINLKTQIEQAQSRLRDQRAQYSAILAAQASAASSRYARQQAQVEEEQAGQVASQVELAQARADLQGLQLQEQQQAQQVREQQKRLQQLQAERSTIVQEQQQNETRSG